ncbi:MAG TPA: PAS domain S-box protein [Rariglobus sp.]|jgi:PAS domain S-box-containing protein|nr:PAS domain S-box protein [Rariglobus sp.]
MAVWIAENHDYLLFVTTSLALFGLLEGWLRGRHPHGRLFFAIWPVLVVLLVAGWVLVDRAGTNESRRIQSFLEGVAPTYAQELERMGHSLITLETPEDDPRYLAMIEAMKRWKAVNPTISDVYTFRRINGKVRLMVDSETDYNHDGKIEGQREQRIPIGREYAEADQGMLDALDGKSTFSDMPVRDEWGVWVSAQVPMRDASGRVEAALGLDYPAGQWIQSIELGRQRMMWLLAIPLLMLGFGGAITGVLKAEIGERAKIEEQLRGSEALLRTAIDSMPFDFWVMDGAGRYVLTNTVSSRNWGDRLGKTLADLELPPAVRKLWENNNRRAFAGELVKGEVTLEISGQTRHSYNIVAPVKMDGKVTGILGLNLDMTERVGAEEALRKSERRLALHVRQTPLAVIEWDLDFCVTAWNPAAEHIFGYTAAEAIGRNALGLIVPDEARTAVMEVWGDILAHRGGTRSTNRNFTKAGKSILCEWYNTPLVDDNGQVIGVASHCQDITERDDLEKQVRQAQKIESLGQLAAGVAHEFNNLLTPMLLRLEMLRSDRAGDPELLASLRSIEDAIEQAARLNQRILSVGQRSSGKREMLLLNSIVDDTLGLLKHTLDRRIELAVQLSPGLGPLSIDRAHVSQIIVNLVINARDALIQKLESGVSSDWVPRIDISTIRTQSARGGGGGVSSAPFARSCQRITIADNGIGMTAEVKAKAFEPFYTTKPAGQGTGLGLAVVWNVVKSLDGWIELESQPGHGTVFHVYFLVPDAPAVAPRLPATPAYFKNERGGGLRILLVEDNVVVAETINTLLTRSGHAVTYAQNGEEAWELLRLRETGFDLVITDENMPVLSGIGLIHRLREAGNKIRVIVVSGHLEPEKMTELKRLKVTDVLQKPFLPNELFALLKS